MTFNAPFTRTTNTIGLSYDSSLVLSGTQLKVSNPNLWQVGTNASGASTLNFTQGVSGINPAGTGFVGIGSADPKQRLDVWGLINSSGGYTISASSTTNSALSWNNYGVSAIGCAGSAGSYSTSAGVGDLVIRSDTGKQLILQNGSASAGLTINGGNVGIGITNPLRILHLNASTDVSVYLQITNSASGTSAGDGCFIGMDATLLNFVISNAENADMYFRTNGGERIRIKNTGQVGIGLNNPATSFTIKSTYDSEATGFCMDAGDDGTNNKYNLRLYPYVVGAGQVGYKFKIYSSTAGTTDNVLVLGHSGSVGIGMNPNTSYKLNTNGSVNATDFFRNGSILHNYLFNNNGNNNGNFTDFNSPTEYGYNYITGNANSPGVNGAGQYYSWTIGLGANYGYGSASGWYGAQFALPRNVGSPYLCVRYIENGGRGGWNKISAGYADSCSASGISGQTGMWASVNRPGPYRLYRRDADDGYSVQTYWTGSRWRLYGYYNNDTGHADTHVGYADSAGGLTGNPNIDIGSMYASSTRGADTINAYYIYGPAYVVAN